MVLSGIKITCHNSEKIILYGAKKNLLIIVLNFIVIAMADVNSIPFVVRCLFFKFFYVLFEGPQLFA